MQLASAKIGAILVNINPSYRLHELEYALQHSGCKMIVTADRFKYSDLPEDDQRPDPGTQLQQPGQAAVGAFPGTPHSGRFSEEKVHGTWTWKEFLELSNGIDASSSSNGAINFLL